MNRRSARILKMNVRPAEYLREGLENRNGRLRTELSGRYSLATAYQLRDEGFTPGKLLAYRELVAAAARPYTGSLAQPERVPISSDAKEAMANIAGELTDDCGRFSEIIVSALPHLTDWRSFGLLLDHIERIAAQLGVISRVLPAPAPPGRAQRMRMMRAASVATSEF